MEERLVPLNGLLGLVLGDGLYPSPLKDAGYTLVGLEVPTRTPLGSVVVDVLLHRPTTGELVLCEVKSGANVEDDQARRYGEVDATALVQTAHVTMTQRLRPWVTVLYVCLEQHADRIRQGLTSADAHHDVLAIGPHRAELHSLSMNRTNLAELLRDVPLPTPPPAVVAFDHESAVEVIIPAVHAEMIAALSHRRQQVSVPWLTEQAAPQSAIYGQKARRQLERQVGDAARAIATTHPSSFDYVRGGNNVDDVVRLLKTPEDNDPRGRTQGYQALARPRRGRSTRSRPLDPAQLDLLPFIEAHDDEDDAQLGEEGDR